MADDGTNHEAESNSDSDSDTDPPPRDETGQFPTKVEHEDILEYILRRNGAPTRDIAEEFGVSLETVRRKCNELVARDEITAIEASTAKLWQVPLEYYIEDIDEYRDAYVQDHIRD